MSVFAGNLPFNFTEDALKSLFGEAGEIVSAKIVKRGKEANRSLGYGFVDFAPSVNVDKVAADFNKRSVEGREIVVEVARPKTERPPKEQKPRAPRAEGGNGGNAEGGAKEGKPRRRRAPRRKAEGGEGGNGGNNAGAAEGGEGAKKRNPRKPLPPKEKLPIIKDHGVFVANLPFNVDSEQLTAVFNGSGVNVVAAHIITRRTGRSKGYGFAQFASDADRDKAISFAKGKIVGEREISVSAVQERKEEQQ